MGNRQAEWKYKYESTCVYILTNLACLWGERLYQELEVISIKTTCWLIFHKVSIGIIYSYIHFSNLKNECWQMNAKFSNYFFIWILNTQCIFENMTFCCWSSWSWTVIGHFRNAFIVAQPIECVIQFGMPWKGTLQWHNWILQFEAFFFFLLSTILCLLPEWILLL